MGGRKTALRAASALLCAVAVATLLHPAYAVAGRTLSQTESRMAFRNGASVSLQTAQPGFCVYVDGSGIGASIMTAPCVKDVEQVFNLVDVGDRYYKLSAFSNKRCMQPAEGATKDAGFFTMWLCDSEVEASMTEFGFFKNSDGTVTLRSRWSGKCLGFPHSFDQNIQMVDCDCGSANDCTGNNAISYTVRENLPFPPPPPAAQRQAMIGQGAFAIKTIGEAKKCVSILNDPKENGAYLMAQDCAASDAQTFNVEQRDNVYYRITAMEGQMCVEAAGWPIEEKSFPHALQMWNCAEALYYSWDDWSFHRNSDGTWTMKNRYSELCLGFKSPASQIMWQVKCPCADCSGNEAVAFELAAL